jgi:hypothetical protein
MSRRAMAVIRAVGRGAKALRVFDLEWRALRVGTEQRKRRSA